MSIPTIYSNVKQANPGDEITVIASIGSGVWGFPNADPDDIEIVSGSLNSNVLTFKCLSDYDPLTIIFSAIQNNIVNGSEWDDDINSIFYGSGVLGDYWITPANQSNEILSGYNFDGNSQRITQTLSGGASISQYNLTVSGESYGLELDYRAYSDITMSIGGHSFELSATDEGPSFPIYPIQHGSGLFNFETTDGGNVKWLLADGTVSNSLSISTQLIEGTSYLTMDSFNGQGINSDGTYTNYIGTLSDLPSGLGTVQLEGTNVVGDIIQLNHVQDVVHITDSDSVYGNVQELSGLSYAIDLSGCPNISGDISQLNFVEIINLEGTSVSGSILENSEALDIRLNNTNLDKDDLELCLINLASRALSGGYFECYDNMPTVNSSEACSAIFTLTNSLEWTVIVNSECGY